MNYCISFTGDSACSVIVSYEKWLKQKQNDWNLTIVSTTAYSTYSGTNILIVTYIKTLKK
jgi:hypothetical protein